MSAPDPESMGLYAKALAGAAAALYLPWKVWTYVDNRFAKKHQVAESLQIVTNELATQRMTIAKIFDQLRDSDQRATDRHMELMRELGKKADR